MLVVKIVDGLPQGAPLVETNFRQQFPLVSFSNPLALEEIQPYGYAFYKTTDEPEAGIYEVIESEDAIEEEPGIWRQAWKVTEVNDEAKAIIDHDQAQLERGERDLLLRKSDWTQLPDSGIGTKRRTAWKEYRKALRNLPTQEGFPWEFEWPTQPK